MNEYCPVNLRSVRVSIIRGGMLRLFSRRLRRFGRHANELAQHTTCPLAYNSDNSTIEQISKTIEKWKIPTFVFTRPPDNVAHIKALEILKTCPNLELIYNSYLHAKVYACVAPYPYGFALLGSANLTHGSERLYEIGLLILSGGGGDEIVKELLDFGLTYLRTRPESQVIKKISHRR